LKSEHQLQTEIVEWFSLTYPQYIIFAVPNGAMLGGNVYAQIAKLKKEGLLNGVSDLIIVLNQKILFVEVKSQKGTLTDYQKIFLNNVVKLGHSAFLVRSLEEFKNIFK